MTSLPAPLTPQEKTATLQTWRETVFGKVIRAIGTAGSIAYFAYLALNYQTLSRGLFLAYTLAYLLIIKPF